MPIPFSWIDGVSSGRLAIMPKPNGGEWLQQDISALRTAGVNVLVSMLCAEENQRFELEKEPDLCRAAGIDFMSYPIRDHSIPPDNADTRDFITQVHSRLIDGKSIVIHCYAGIGRSSLLAASLMVVQGSRVEEAFEYISRARGLQVPDTTEQLEWVSNFARSLRPGGA